MLGRPLVILMDSFFLKAITNEFEALLKGARISKISQPKKEVVLLEVSALTGGTKKLLICCGANYPRLHLTQSSFPSLPSPPAFCMNLRKHLLGSRISSSSQKGLERVVEIATEKRDSMGRVRRYSLMCEIMGRWSNLILVERQTGLILDALKLVGRRKTRERPIIRNLPYKLPPTQGKLNPLLIEREAFEKGLRLKGASLSPERMKSRLLELFEGLSPGVSQAIVDKVPKDRRWEGLWDAFQQAMEEFREGVFKPHILLDEEGVDYLQISALQVPGVPPERLLPFESANEAAEFFYKGAEERAAMRAARDSLMGTLSHALRRKERILKLLARDLKASDRAEEFRERGDLLLAHLKEVSRGMEEVRLQADGGEMVIALDPKIDGPANAQKYFKRYKKLKRLKSFGERRRKAIEREVVYLQGVELALKDAATLEDMEEIARELEEAGYIKKDEKKPPHPSPQALKPYRRLKLDGGWEALVGRHNRGNDYLRRTAGASDLWLHAQGLPGAHVLILNREGLQEVPENVLHQAALAAAYFSRGREATKLPVDYAWVKDVKKPKSARPGQVTYSHQKTLWVRPDDFKPLAGRLKDEPR